MDPSCPGYNMLQQLNRKYTSGVRYEVGYGTRIDLTLSVTFYGERVLKFP